MKTFTQACTLVLLSLPLMAGAAGKTASAAMQVTFEVKESCTVRTPADAAKPADQAAPAVACQLNTPYQMTRDAGPAATVDSRDAHASALRQRAASGEWTITF